MLKLITAHFMDQFVVDYFLEVSRYSCVSSTDFLARHSTRNVFCELFFNTLSRLIFFGFLCG